MSHTINWDKHYSVVKLIGEMSINKIEIANKNWHGDKRLYKTNAAIWDLTDCDMKGIQHSELKYTVAVDIGASNTLSQFKHAFVVTKPHDVSFVKTYIDNCNKAGSTWEYEVFESLDDSIAWIHA